MKLAATVFTVMFASLTGLANAEEAFTPVYPGGVVPTLPFTPGILTDDGTLYISGHIAYVDGEVPEHARDGDNDIQDQAKIVMDNLGKVLEAAGYSYSDAVRATVYLDDIADYGAFNEVYAGYWGEGEVPPARVALEIAQLPGARPGAPVLVEVSMIAHK